MNPEFNTPEFLNKVERAMWTTRLITDIKDVWQPQLTRLGVPVTTQKAINKRLKEIITLLDNVQ
jgi:hypothetical protein